MFFIISALTVVHSSFTTKSNPENSWIRINQLSYTINGGKVAAWCSKVESGVRSWELISADNKKIVFTGKMGKAFGAYGPFTQTYRLNFSTFTKPGRYYLQCGDTKSPEFEIGDDVYKGAADFCLRYMRQQRCGFNPFFKDSCHTHDGYTLYGEKAGLKDSTHIDVTGGWHDATDYLQYSSTSANAVYQMLAAYRDFPQVFGDTKQSNGLDGSNGMADVLDEAKWGLDWLLKMHPKDDWMFNQIADDRDHAGMRLPKEDSFYGKGFERPVYFVTGEPQQRGKFMNDTKGTSSIAGKFASAFALGYIMLHKFDKKFAGRLFLNAKSAYRFGNNKKGYTQTASVRSPYIYAEENWSDDMELGAAALSNAYEYFYTDYKRRSNRILPDVQEIYDFRRTAYIYSKEEKITPWIGADTAKHYQWYPFVNAGHYELAKQLKDKRRDTIIGYYKQGIQLVWNRAKQNAFYRGVPFIWCSNNLTTTFAMQCYWYRQLTNDKTFSELEQANFDWLFGCNPWGTSMVYGLPSWGDTSVDPHSSLTFLKKYPIDGGLVDGPVNGNIYKNLIGISLHEADEYAAFQSDVAVYHDDVGDYSTNEPTMDGTASLIYLLAAKEAEALPSHLERGKGVKSDGAIIRGDSTQKNIALVFTGDEFADGGNHISQTLAKENIKASFFFTGNFYRNPVFKNLITGLKNNGHYLGPHSDKHLLYCDWAKRDSLLVTKDQFKNDLLQNYAEMKQFGIDKAQENYFMPPYEWYNDSIAAWAKELNVQLINFTPGIKSNADYTYPELKNYQSSQVIYQSIINYEKDHKRGLNGFILLLHIGTDPRRTDKFYDRLESLIKHLKTSGYHFKTVAGLLR